MRYARLLCVSPDNHNKVYELHEQPGGVFEVRFGRVGTALQRRAYPLRQWDGKVREKLSRGYRDVTHFSVVGPAAPRHRPIADPDVADFVDALERAARANVGRHYDVQVAAVTAPMLAEADAVLARLAGIAAAPAWSTDAANDALMDLYHAIPRRMARVGDHLVAHADALRARLSAEQDLLDGLRTQVVLAATDAPAATPTQTLLDALGVVLSPVSGAERAHVLRHVEPENQGLVRRVFAAHHAASAGAYTAHRAAAADASERLLWHGSRTENWLSVLRTGLVLHPTSAVLTGKMFGYGLYFADRFAKSVGYTSLCGSRWAGGGATSGVLALFRVHTGRRLEVKRWQPAHTTTTRAGLAARYDSLHARGGADLVHDEYIVYTEAQATLVYLVEIAA